MANITREYIHKATGQKYEVYFFRKNGYKKAGVRALNANTKGALWVMGLNYFMANFQVYQENKKPGRP